MLKKTTGSYFLKYGKSSNAFKLNKKLIGVSKTCTSQSFSKLTSYSSSCYIEAPSESMLAIAILNSKKNIKLFIIHKNTRINRGVPFAIFPLDTSASYNFYTYPNSTTSDHFLDSPYIYKSIKPQITIPELYAYYYSVKSPGYHFDGECHSHFELTFVDNGSLETTIEKSSFSLNSYNLIFYAPHQHHTQKITSDKPCSYLTLIFDLHCENYSPLLNKVFICSRDHYQVLTKISHASVSTDPYSKELMLIYLQELIILLLQGEKQEIKAINPIRQHFENEMLEEILSYIHANTNQTITVEEICRIFSISRSSLQHLFKSNLKVAPKRYISNLKLEKSKLLIKEQRYTLSEIASMLGFNSIHYFSRKFTQTFNITPSDYAKKIYDEH